MYVIEFGRGRDKKKRKKRSEMGQNVRKGAKIGAIAGAASVGVSVLANRKNLKKVRDFRFDLAVNEGLSPSAARKAVAVGQGLGIGVGTAQTAARGAGTGALIGAGYTALKRSNRGPSGNYLADRKAEQKRRKRSSR